MSAVAMSALAQTTRVNALRREYHTLIHRKRNDGISRKPRKGQGKSKIKKIRQKKTLRETRFSLQQTAQPGPPSTEKYMILLLSYVVFSLGAGYMAGVQPSGAGWRDFSWHPFLMTCAFVGAFGTAAVTKKRGGYTNTKAHGILAWLGNFLALGM